MSPRKDSTLESTGLEWRRSPPPGDPPSDPAGVGSEADPDPEVEIEQARQLSRAHLSGLLEALVFCQ